MSSLAKRSPLAPVFRAANARMNAVAGWEVALRLGEAESESAALKDGSVLVDWSHIGKISVRGAGAVAQVSKIKDAASSVPPLKSVLYDRGVILRLTADEYLILCEPGSAPGWMAKMGEQDTATIDLSGGLGALYLGGARQEEVMERSSAMNLQAAVLPPGAVVQTTVHLIPCTVFRLVDGYLFLQGRDYTQSLFDAFMDIGKGVGLVAAGLDCVPVHWGGLHG